MNPRKEPWRAPHHAPHEWSEFVDAVGDAIVVYDADLRYVALNRAAAELSGCARDAVVGRLRDDVLGPDDDSARMREALATGTVLVVQREGEAFETTYRPHRAASGGMYLVGVARTRTPEGERLRSLFENNPEGIGAIDTSGTITEINDAALALVGYRRAEVVGRPFTALFLEDDIAPLREAFRRCLGGERQRVEARAARRDGRTIELECTGSPTYAGSDVCGAYFSLQDVSGRKRAERALQRQHERIRELYLCATESNPSSEEHVRRTLELGCRMLGMEAAALYDATTGTTVVSADARVDRTSRGAQVAGRLCRAAMASPEGLALDDADRSASLLAVEGEQAIAAFIGVPVDVAGERFGALCFATRQHRAGPFEPGDHDLVQLIGVLVGAEFERGRARLHLRSLAYYDALTGLPNRLLLRERLDAALVARAENGEKCAVLFLDLDRFKDVNDTFGHVLGDRLLQLAAERIVGCVRSSETVARMGGDEFIVVMPTIRDAAEAIALAERLLRAIDAPFSISGHEQYTTTSIGVALAPDDGTDSDALIKHADIAMYRAKDRGRNQCVLFTPELDRSTSRRVSNEQGMRRAIERAEFRTYFQPIVDVREGTVYGVEALARWEHPALSILRPEAFISNTEENGLIVRLGEVVLEDACRRVIAWQDAGMPDLHLAVNFSARQFREPHFVALLATVLERTAFPARLLEIEISESVAMADAETSVGIMRALKDLGARVVLDNVGTGYSSIAYLRRFPLDGLKIDRSFVAAIGRERDDEMVVQTVIGLARNLALDVVAEGVETADQVEFLRRARCNRLQGHFFSPALPAGGCERYLRDWTTLVAPGAAATP